MTGNHISRRSFLKVLGLGTGAVLVAPELLVHLQPPHPKMTVAFFLSNELISDAPAIANQLAQSQLERMEAVERQEGRLKYRGTWQLVGENPRWGRKIVGRAANGRFVSTGRWSQTFRRYVLVPTP